MLAFQAIEPATDGPPERGQRDRTGLVFRGGQPEDIAEEVRRIIEDDSLSGEAIVVHNEPLEQ